MSRLDDCEALFVTQKRPINRLGRRAAQREIDKIAKQSKIEKNVHAHLLRSSISTHLLNSGMNITSISEILGHSLIETTMDYYAKLDNRVVSAEFRKYS